MPDSLDNTKSSPVLYRVSAKSNVIRLSGFITKSFLEGTLFELRAIGAGAVNQTVKALAEARGKLARSGRDVSFIVYFSDIPGFSDSKDTEISASSLVFKLVER